MMESGTYDDLLARLESFATLPTGWNGYTAPPPTKRTINEARRFLEDADKLNYLPSRLAPSATAGVTMGYRASGNPRHVHVEFFDHGGVYLLLSDDVADPTVFRVEVVDGAIPFAKTIEQIEKYLA